MCSRPLVLLVQLPIPSFGAQPIHGNIPLAAAYLKLYARRQGLEDHFRIEMLPAGQANTLGDRGLIEAILQRRPRLVGFTCYVWNIERTLWLARQLRAQRPKLQIALGGPEITADNAWALAEPAVDYAVLGEGEQTFAELLSATAGGLDLTSAIPGLWTRRGGGPAASRAPLDNLDLISSPYLEGILDAAEDRTYLLETTRGCVYRCKFCYYPKSYDRLWFLSRPQIVAGLRHAAAHGAEEVFLLDPTLNQRPELAAFLELLAQCNAERRFTYSAELRAEGIRADTAQLLRKANFTEVEVGLQSTDPRVQRLVDRKVHLPAFERGVRAMLDVGIRVKVDLILGLPGDTPDAFRRSIDYLLQRQLYSEVQVFNLSILPGTALRQEAQALSLTWQERPPYYVLGTPTLSLEQMVDLMDEAQEAFGVEFDPLPAPSLPRAGEAELRSGRPIQSCAIDLDAVAGSAGRVCERLPRAADRAAAFDLHLRSSDFHARRDAAVELVRRLLDDCPHTTLQVILEPTANARSLPEAALPLLLHACYQSSSYLDRFYSLHPARLAGAKRLVVLMPLSQREQMTPEWIAEVGQFASLAWRADTPVAAENPPDDLADHEFLLGPE